MVENDEFVSFCFMLCFGSHVMFLQCKFLTKQTLFCFKFQQSSFQSGSPISLSTFWREICFLHLPNQVLVSGILGFGWLKLVKVLWFKGVKCGCGILGLFYFPQIICGTMTDYCAISCNMCSFARCHNHSCADLQLTQSNTQNL